MDNLEAFLIAPKLTTTSSLVCLWLEQHKGFTLGFQEVSDMK